jgi:hypothetical protein
VVRGAGAGHWPDSVQSYNKLNDVVHAEKTSIGAIPGGAAWRF